MRLPTSTLTATSSSARRGRALALLPLAILATALSAAAAADAKGERTLNVAFITDLHLGEHCNGDLSLEGCKSVRNFHDAVAHLPEISSKRFPLDGVFVSGDITTSALREQFEKAREVLDAVQVPWWPLLGNHDAWSYEKHSDGSFTQTDTPTGDQEFAAVFGDVLSGAVDAEPKAKYWPTKPCRNGNYGYDSWFQNFEVTFEQMPDLTFLAVDWVSRKNALPEPGVGPEVELHDFECGSFPWLRDRLHAWKEETTAQGQAAKEAKRFFLVQHYPFHNRDILSPFGENIFYNFTFDKTQNLMTQELLEEDWPVAAYLGVQAGHMHRWFNGTAFTKHTAGKEEWLSLLEWETSACKGNWINEDYTSATSVFSFKQKNDGSAPWLASVWFTWLTPQGEWKDRLMYHHNP